MGKFVLFLLIPCLSFCTWQTQVIDTDGDVGGYSSIAVDSEGKPQISYTDFTLGRLKHAWRGTDSTWNIKSLGTTTGGYYSSIALSGSKTHIAHYNVNLETLLYTESEISGTLTLGTQTYYGTYTYLTKTIDSGKVGRFCDIAIDADGDPQISYYNEKKKALNYAFWTGLEWGTSTIDYATTSDRGRFSSLFLAEDSLPIISYYDATTKDLRLAFWNLVTWGSGTIDTIGDVGMYSSIAGTGGTLHIAYYDATNGNLKYATNPENMLKWKVTTGSEVSSSPAISQEGIIYCGSDDGYLYSLNYDGTIKWKCPTGGPVDSSPAIGTNIIYVGSDDNYLYAINPLTGTFTWRYLTGGDIDSSPAIGTNGVIYVGSDDNYLYAINPNGTLKWRLLTGDKVSSSPAIGTNGVIYVGSDDNYLYAINPLTGTFTWRYLTGGDIDSSPAIGTDGTIYVGSDDNCLYAIKTNGTLTWKYETGGDIDSSPLVGPDGVIYVGSDDNYLYAINPNGTLKWRYLTGGAIDSSAAIGNDGTIYVGSNDNYLYAIKSNGTLRWKYETSGDISSFVLLGEDGIIYFGSADNCIYSLHPNNGVWTSSTIDSTGDVGKYCSLALTSTGVPYIAYYDATNKDLKIAYKGGAGWTRETIDSVGDVGMYSGIVMYNNIAHISYYDNTNGSLGNLKYATNGTTTPPNAPTGLSATAISSSTINLAWSDNSSNESWFIIERGSTITAFVQIGTTTLATYTDTGLASNTTCYYRVAAFNTYGTSAYSNTASATTWSLPPNAPSSLMATATSSFSVDLSWSDNSTNETGFVIERGTDGATFAYIGITTLATYTNTGLFASTTYYYRVASFNGFGTSSYSNIAQTTTLNSIPLAPSTLTALAYSTSSINLAWFDNSTNEKGVAIERGTDGITFVHIGTTTLATYTDTPLASYTTYYYRVAAYNEIGTSAYSNTASATTHDMPPTDLQATATSASTINLSLQDNSSTEIWFVVERGTTITTLAQVGTTTLATYTDTGLASNTTYYYRVYAQTPFGTTTYSNIASATTFDLPLPAPSNLIAVALSNSSIRLNWQDNSSNETGFIIERLNGTYTYIAQVSSNTLEYINSGLLPNTTYYYRVAAFNTFGTSAYSNIASATTGATWLYISPTYSLVGSGSTQTLTINIDNVSNMIGASIYLSFDPSIISVTAIATGTFPSEGEVLSTSTDNTSGTATYSVCLTSGSATGSGVLATIALTGVSTGTSLLSFVTSTVTVKKTHLIDNNGSEIPFSYTNGTVSCSVMGSITGKVVSSVCGTTFMEFSGIAVKIGSYTTSTNGSSTFNFSAIPAGSHTLWADTTGAGFASNTVYISGGDQDLGTFTLLAADTDDSGQVNLTDFWKFRQSYGSPTPEVEADFDHDLDCDMQDFFILRSNFGKTRSLAKGKANGKTILYIEPQTGRAKLGDEIAIDLKIANVSELIGVSLILDFSSELNLISLSKGGFVNSFAVLREQKENGRIIYDLGLLQGEVSGSGTILSVKFLVGRAGSATISIGESKLMDSCGKWMGFGSQSAYIKIEETCASLWIEPKNMEVFKEETFTSQVFINVQSLIGARVKVKYLSNLSLLDVGQGAFQTTVFLSATSTDGVEVILANVDGISGSGSLFSLRFLAKELGTGAITFELADLRNKENEQIPVSIAGAEVSVKKRLTCDFNQNNEIDFEDLLGLISFWKRPSPVYDIGPASGSPPDLISNPDGVVDFEDLMVFCLMWNWNKKVQNSKFKIQNSKFKIQNSFIWMEEDGDWVVVKYKGIDEALGGRYVLRFDQAVEIEKIEGRLKAFVSERIGNDLILEFGFIDAPPEGEVCRIKIERKEWIKIQGEAEIRDMENKKILLEGSSLFLETLSLSDSICYPNPSRIGVVNFKVPPDTSIQIYNIAGERIFEKESLGGSLITWHTKNIASGTYIYILTYGKDKKTGKVGVMR